MKKYIITIVDLNNNIPVCKQADEYGLEKVIKSIGGYENLIISHNKNGDTIGMLKDRPAKFSILCYTPN